MTSMIYLTFINSEASAASILLITHFHVYNCIDILLKKYAELNVHLRHSRKIYTHI